MEITVAPKGFGSVNMSRVFMLKPADGIEGVKQAVIRAVKDAGPNACPPMVIGVGIGGTFEKCALLAKKALTRELGSHSEIPYVKDFEIEVLEAINNLGIGPGGLGRPCYSNRIKCRNLSDTYCRTSGCRKHLLSCKSPHYKSVIKGEGFHG